MCDRVPNLDLRFFVTSVAIQRQTGGDLAEILDRIGHVIRERFKILGQVKYDGRRAAVGHRPDRHVTIGLFLLMLWMKPTTSSCSGLDPMGSRCRSAIILVLIEAYAIKKIVDIKV